MLLCVLSTHRLSEPQPRRDRLSMLPPGSEHEPLMRPLVAGELSYGLAKLVVWFGSYLLYELAHYKMTFNLRTNLDLGRPASLY